MRKYYYSILTIILLLPNIVIAKKNIVKCDIDILKIRAEATINSAVVDIVKTEETMKVIDETRESYMIDAVKAKWHKIETNNKKTGWVFSGFLSSIDGKTIPFGSKNIIGEWVIDDNDGIGAVILNFVKNGILIIRGENSKEFDGNYKWVYHSDTDSIELIFNNNQKEWQARVKKLKNGSYSSIDKYLLLNEEQPSLLISLSRQYYDEKKKKFENISFPFFGYFVSKKVM